MSQNLPKRSLGDLLSLRHPNHLVLAGANNRNVIITYRFLTAPVQANREFFWHTDCIFYCKYFPLIYARVTRVPPRDFAQKAKSLRGQLLQSNACKIHKLTEVKTLRRKKRTEDLKTLPKC